MFTSTNLPYLIRQATSADLPAMEWEGEFTHYRRIYAEAYKQAQEGQAVLWVVECAGNSLIGQVFVQLHGLRRDNPDGLKRAYIYGFRIRPSYRRQGIGGRLLFVVERDLVDRGIYRAALNVARVNKGARRFYERHGYYVVGRDPGNWSYLYENGVRRDVHEPAWRMEKDLSNIN